MGQPNSARVPHKHAALIKAWADGAEIQYRSPRDDSCVDTHKKTVKLYVGGTMSANNNSLNRKYITYAKP